jgi:hypothetical protein
MEKLLPFAAFVPLLLLAYFVIRRLVNLGMSRWWGLAVLAPFLNLWLGYRCFACPAGYAYHKKLDAPGIVVAILYGLAMISLMLVLAAFVALIAGAIESPALQNQLRGFIKPD